MKEKYEPTPEEIKKAEEMLTPSEKELSEKRKEFVADVREGSVPPNENPFHFSKEGNDLSGDEYRGSIGGHKFVLFNYREARGGFTGTVDGMPLPNDTAGRLVKKYGYPAGDEARFRKETSSLEYYARREVNQSEEEFKQAEDSKKVESILKELKDKGLI